MSEVHSRFGGSIADRWMNCAGSVALCATVPKLPSSIYADEGKRHHTLGEYCLRNGYESAKLAADESSYANADGSPIVWTDEGVAAVQVYLDAVYAEMAAAPDSELYVEQRLKMPGMEDVFGTADAIVYSPSRKRVAVFDYKHGVGISVSPEENAQAKFYAVLVVFEHADWSVGEVELFIIQPRARDADETGAVKSWCMDTADIINFAGEIEAGVTRAKYFEGHSGYDLHPGLKTGSWCRWCDAAAICPAREREALDAMGAAFEDVTLVDATALDEPANLTGERIAQVLKGLTILSGWASQVQEFAEAHMIAGTLEVPGWKVVPKIGRAKWIDADEEIASYLDLMFGIEAKEVLPPKLATITAVEKMMKAAGAKKDDIDDLKLKYTIKESSGVTIAPVGDRRDALTPKDKFEGVNMEIGNG